MRALQPIDDAPLSLPLLPGSTQHHPHTSKGLDCHDNNGWSLHLHRELHQVQALPLQAASQGSPRFEEIQILCQIGHLDTALHALYCSRTPPEQNLYLCLLKACRKRKAISGVELVRQHLLQHHVELTGLLGDYLVIALAQCGDLENAQQVFDALIHHTVYSWTALISAYTDSGHSNIALELYLRMREEGMEPNHYTFVSLFKACGSIGNLKEGRKLHGEARRRGFTTDVFVSNTLVSMYGKLGKIFEAEDVFMRLTKRDLVSWNAMLSAYIDQGLEIRAFQCYRQMQDEGLCPDQVTIMMILQACGILAEKEEAIYLEGEAIKPVSLEIGQGAHADAKKKGLTAFVFIANTLISVYGKCWAICHAEGVFVTSCDNVVAWNAMMFAYAEKGLEEKALQLYRQMLKEGLSPDQQTYTVMLSACATLAQKVETIAVNGISNSLMSLEIGQALHHDGWRDGFIIDTFLASSLVSMYGNCGNIVAAENVFNGMHEQDVVLWSAMLSAYAEQGQGEKALQFFKQMQEEGWTPNKQTLVVALQACCTLADKDVIPAGRHVFQLLAWDIGQALHVDAEMKGFALDVFVCNTLVSLYGKCGHIFEAQIVFEGISHRDLVSWNAMLSVYVEHGHWSKIMQLYGEMQKVCSSLDDVTLTCVLQACSKTGSMEICRQVHFVAASAADGLGMFLANTLIRAYGSCASMRDAQAVFDGLPKPDLVSWNACIAGYLQEGNHTASFHMFEKMRAAGMQPDGSTFLLLLSACNHVGLVDDAFDFFEYSIRYSGLTPESKHYSVLMNLLGRAADGRTQLVQIDNGR